MYTTALPSMTSKETIQINIVPKDIKEQKQISWRFIFEDIERLK